MPETAEHGPAGPRRSRKAAVAYRIDAGDRITWVNPAWDVFALSNGAPELTGERVRGNSLSEFIADKETRHLYGLLFAKVRRTRRPLRIPFNCDSPTQRRFMELALSARPAGGIALAGHLLREEARAPAPLLDRRATRSESLLCICGWCKRVEAGANDWVEVEEAIRDLTLFSAAVLPQLTHGMCPTCRSLLYEQLHREAPP